MVENCHEFEFSGTSSFSFKFSKKLEELEVLAEEDPGSDTSLER